MRRVLARRLGALLQGLPRAAESSQQAEVATAACSLLRRHELPSVVRQLRGESAMPSSPGVQCSAATFQLRQFSLSHPALAEPGSTEAEDPQLNPLLMTPGPAEGPDGTVQAGSPSRYGPGRAGAKLRAIPMSPKKMNHFATLLRRRNVQDAMTECLLSPKKAAKICAGVIESAKANAANNHGLDADRLEIDIINVGRGQHLKRASIHGRGKAGVRHKHFCHIEVVLKESDRQPRMKYVRPLLERPLPERRRRAASAA